MTLNKTYVDNAEQFHNSHAYFSLPIENILYTYYFSEIIGRKFRVK